MHVMKVCMKRRFDTYCSDCLDIVRGSDLTQRAYVRRSIVDPGLSLGRLRTHSRASMILRAGQGYGL